MEGKLAPYPLVPTAWPAPVQLVSNTPSMSQAASNTSLDLGDLRWPSSLLLWLSLPSSLLTVATLALSPLLLVTILRSQQLRQDPHYLLLANTLLSDLAYLLFHTFISSSNLSSWEPGRIACGILTDAVFASCVSTILSLTAMVLHTYLAVAHPLRYLSIVSCGAVRKTVALIWLVAFSFPTFLLWFSKRQDAQLGEQGASCILPLSLGTGGRASLVLVTHISILCLLFLCTALIAYCFWKIYAEARTSGICTKGYSRARGTLLMHSVLISLYVSAGVMFSLDTVLTKYHHIGTKTHAWLLAANGEVLMMLPRAMLPYLYALRYQQLLGLLRGLFSAKRHKTIFTMSQNCQVHSWAGRG
ncbi:probable G-protein coupled receptor 148 [Otolemur garnettii]|nr:probable G-protein coupled receptor 148 [Otolemur garnettii]